MSDIFTQKDKMVMSDIASSSGAEAGQDIVPRTVDTSHIDIASTSGGGQGQGHPQTMKDELLKAASSGDSSLMMVMASQDPNILRGVTPQGNNCLHIASIYGYTIFSKDVLEIEESLLLYVNIEGETPLHIAITLGHVALATYLLGWFRLPRGIAVEERTGEYLDIILAADNYRSNVLHHAIRNGHIDLALELITAKPALSQGVNKFNESPMFLAAMRNLPFVFCELLEIDDSSHEGSDGRNALHAAVRNGSKDIASQIMQKRPHMAKKADNNENTPIRLAVIYNKVELLKVLLGYDPSLGYEVSSKGFTLLTSAATRGHVNIAKELLKYCPDAPCRHLHTQELTCLHAAIINGHVKFVEFILMAQELKKVINMRDGQGKTALHYAVKKCNPTIIHALLSCKHIDTTQHDKGGGTAASLLQRIKDHTLDLKEVHVLLAEADPKDDDISFSGILGGDEPENIEARKEMKSRTQKYTSNTSLVAILLATITFTAAFTLPGGISSAGLPVMSRKIAFKAFLVCDTLAMCSAFVVAVICLMGRWEDEKFTTYYISITKKLTWFAYMSTLAAFAAGLYTVLDSQLHWLAIGICSLIGILPVMTLSINKWPILKRNFRLGPTWPALMFNYESHQHCNFNFHDDTDLPEGFRDDRV